MFLARLIEVTLKGEWEPQNVGQGLQRYSTSRLILREAIQFSSIQFNLTNTRCAARKEHVCIEVGIELGSNRSRAIDFKICHPSLNSVLYKAA